MAPRARRALCLAAATAVATVAVSSTCRQAPRTAPASPALATAHPPPPPWPSRPRPSPCAEHPSHCAALQVHPPTGALTPAAAERAVAQLSRQVLRALAAGDAALLASLVHPRRGLRVSTDAYVDVAADPHLTRTQLAQSAGADDVRTWGYRDGSGDPIRLTLQDLLRDYFYDRDYRRAPEIGYNHVIHVGNTVVNVFDVFPRATLAEYHFCVEDPARTLDWRSLRLLFEADDGELFLVALLRDHWTI